MPDSPPPRPSRLERRKARTRAALLEAAKRIFAERGRPEASIQEITDTADVGFGSFYNHFESKEALFDEAITQAFDDHANWLDRLLADETDPAVVFATSLRLTARLPTTNPMLARVMMYAPGAMLDSDRGLAPRALRDIELAAEAGRFLVGDPMVALACAAGSLGATFHLIEQRDDPHVAETADEMTQRVLMMFGMSAAEARQLATMPLPVPDPSSPDR